VCAESVPKEIQSRAFFVVGGVGCIVNAVAAMWLFLTTLAPTFVFGIDSWIIGYFLLIIGLILASLGYLGTYCNYGSGVGAASFAIAIVVSVLFLSWTIWHIANYPFYYRYYEEYWHLLTYIWAIIYEIFFVMMILWAVTHITSRYFTDKPGLSLATGIMLIITAVFLEISSILSVVLMMFWRQYHGFQFVNIFELVWTFELVWILLFFTSEILAAILFFMMRIPESSAKPGY